MKEQYTKNMIEKIKKELRLNMSNFIRLEPIFGSKISIDAVEYFDSVVGVKIYAHDVEIASYDYIKKILYSKRHIQNIELCRIKNEIVNDFVQYKKYAIKDKYLKDFEAFKDEVDSNCNMSDYELACMYELQ